MLTFFIVLFSLTYISVSVEFSETKSSTISLGTITEVRSIEILNQTYIDPYWLEEKPDLADQIDSKVKTEYPFAVEVLEKRTENSKVYDLGEERFLLKTSISKVHYKDEQGKFQNIDLTQKNSNIAGFDKLIDTAPYKLYISDKGDRRIYPDRNKPEYISLPSPAFLNKPGKWVSNRELKWESQSYDVSLLLMEDRIKFLATIKRPVQFSSFSFPVQENGASLLNYLGDISYWDSSETPIVRELGMVYQNEILTLSFNLSGMTYPVYIDPTFSVGASADDVRIIQTTSFSVTDTRMWYGNYYGNAASAARFLNINIPQGSTINSAILTMIAEESSSGTTVNVKIYAEDVDNATQIANSTDFDARALTTGTAWSNVPAQTAGTSYDTPDISAEIQTVVDRALWASGNAMNVFLKNDGSSGNVRRMGASWDSTNYAPPDLTITWTAGDSTPPTFSNMKANTTIAGNPVNFSVVINDETGLSGYIFETNNTGTFVNTTWVALSSGGTASNITTLNSTVGVLVNWTFYANDTSNNWAVARNWTTTASAGVTQIRNVSQSLSVTDTKSNLASFRKTSTNTFIISQTAPRIQSLAKSFINQISANQIITKTFSTTKYFSDAFSVNNAVKSVKGFVRSTSDYFTTNDMIAKSFTSVRRISQFLEINSIASRLSLSIKSISQQLNVNNLTSRIALLFKSSSQQITFSSCPSPVSEWKFENNALDTKDGNNGVRYNFSDGYVAGRVGNALQFNSTNQTYVDAGNSSNLNFGTGDFSVEVWIKTSDVSNSPYLILKTDEPTWTAYYGIQLQSSKIITFFLSDGTEYSLSTPTISNLDDGNWHHIVTIRNGNNMAVYYDNVLQTNQDKGVDNVNINNIGSLQISGSGDMIQFFNGTLDEVRIYNYALSAGEITARYNLQPDGTCAVRTLSAMRASSSFLAVNQITSKILTSVRSIQQSFNTSNIASKSALFFKSFTSQISINQIVSKFNILQKTVVQTLNANHIVSKASIGFRNIVQQLNVNNLASRIALLFKSSSQQLNVNQTIIKVGTLFRNVNQNISINQVISRFISIPRTIAQQINMNAVSFKVSSFLRQITNSMSLGNIVQATYKFMRVSTNQISLSIDKSVRSVFNRANSLQISLNNVSTGIKVVLGNLYNVFASSYFSATDTIKNSFIFSRMPTLTIQSIQEMARKISVSARIFLDFLFNLIASVPSAIVGIVAPPSLGGPTPPNVTIEKVRFSVEPRSFILVDRPGSFNITIAVKNLDEDDIVILINGGIVTNASDSFYLTPNSSVEIGIQLWELRKCVERMDTINVYAKKGSELERKDVFVNLFVKGDDDCKLNIPTGETAKPEKWKDWYIFVILVLLGVAYYFYKKRKIVVKL